MTALQVLPESIVVLTIVHLRDTVEDQEEPGVDSTTAGEATASMT